MGAYVFMLVCVRVPAYLCVCVYMHVHVCVHTRVCVHVVTCVLLPSFLYVQTSCVQNIFFATP